MRYAQTGPRTILYLMILALAMRPVLAQAAPTGAISKQVANQTAHGTLSPADGEGQAVEAKTGDTLQYTIVISNTAPADNSGQSDLRSVNLTDDLPQGVELIDDPGKRNIKENLGTVKPGASVTKTFLVKVTGTKPGDIINNQACFVASGAGNEGTRSGCNFATVKIAAATAPAPTPTPPAASPDHSDLPTAGAETALGSAAGATILGYMLLRYRLSMQALADTLKNR